MDKLELVIFDLGGTTIRDSGQVPDAFVAALHAAGFEVSPAELSQARGASKREVIRSLVERRLSPGDSAVDARAGEIFSAFRENLAARFSHGGIEVLPGVEETFAWLHSRQVKIAITVITAIAAGSIIFSLIFAFLIKYEIPPASIKIIPMEGR